MIQADMQCYSISIISAFDSLFPLLIGWLIKWVQRVSNSVDRNLQIVFWPVIKRKTATRLEDQIEEHLKVFKQLFPKKSITPKYHYVIHIHSYVFTLCLPTAVYVLSFETANSYLKKLAHERNFKYLPVSLAKCH